MNPQTFTATAHHPIEDKQKFFKHFIRFVNSGYNENLFHKWFYVQLSFMFGHIAHYNKAGFYSEKFATLEAREDFWQNIKTWRCYGDPAFTYCDVEKTIQAYDKFTK